MAFVGLITMRRQHTQLTSDKQAIPVPALCRNGTTVPFFFTYDGCVRVCLTPGSPLPNGFSGVRNDGRKNRLSVELRPHSVDNPIATMYIFSQISSVNIDHLSVTAPCGTAIITDPPPLSTLKSPMTTISGRPILKSSMLGCRVSF